MRHFSRKRETRWVRLPVLALLLAATVFRAETARATERVVPYVYATIQAGVDAAVEGDRVLVFDGVYTGSGNHDIDPGSKNITVDSESGNPAACIIDCQQAGRAFRIHGGQSSATRITGFTIRNGLAPPLADPKDSDEEALGGAILILNSSPAVINCVFTGNSAPLGGAIHVDFGSGPLLADCTFTGNQANKGAGGGLSLENSSANVLRCTFSGNFALDFGGGISSINTLSLNLTNCTFSRNTADSIGGGVYITGGTSLITNCVFDSNAVSDFGGGLGIDHGGTSLNNCTFSNNTAGQNGGAVALLGFVTLLNSILWGDSAPADPEIYFVASPTSNVIVGNSDVEGGLPPGVQDDGGNRNSPPQFARNPGTLGVHDPGDLHLRSTSPCVDAGRNDALPADSADLDGNGDTLEPLPIDLDGNPRISGAVVDMGAYEQQRSPSFVDIRLAVVVGRDPGTHELSARLTLSNVGRRLASSVQITDAQIGSQSFHLRLPSPPVLLGAGQSRTVTLSLPAMPAGQKVVLKLTGKYLGGTFGGSFRVTLP